MAIVNPMKIAVWCVLLCFSCEYGVVVSDNRVSRILGKQELKVGVTSRKCMMKVITLFTGCFYDVMSFRIIAGSFRSASGIMIETL